MVWMCAKILISKNHKSLRFSWANVERMSATHWVVGWTLCLAWIAWMRNVIRGTRKWFESIAKYICCFEMFHLFFLHYVWSRFSVVRVRRKITLIRWYIDPHIYILYWLVGFEYFSFHFVFVFGASRCRFYSCNNIGVLKVWWSYLYL